MENNKKRKSLKKRTQNVALGVTVATTLGATLAPATVGLAETASTSNEVYQLDNPYKLLMNALSSSEFKQACSDRDAKKYRIF